jgi:hypothetical protein
MMTIRWVLALPAGIAAGIAAQAAFRLLFALAKALGFTRWGNLDYEWSLLLANGIMGWATVVATVAVVPYHKKITAYATCALCVFFAGFSACASVMIHSYFGIACAVALIAGSAIGAVEIAGRVSYEHE